MRCAINAVVVVQLPWSVTDWSPSVAGSPVIQPEIYHFVDGRRSAAAAGVLVGCFDLRSTSLDGGPVDRSRQTDCAVQSPSPSHRVQLLPPPGVLTLRYCETQVTATMEKKTLTSVGGGIKKVGRADRVWSNADNSAASLAGRFCVRVGRFCGYFLIDCDSIRMCAFEWFDNTLRQNSTTLATRSSPVNVISAVYSDCLEDQCCIVCHNCTVIISTHIWAVITCLLGAADKWFRFSLGYFLIYFLIACI